jgi:hypothetical protein
MTSAFLLRVIGRWVLFIIVPSIVLGGIGGCSDSNNDPPAEEPKMTHPTFTATLSGAVKDKIAGAGIVTYLPLKDREAGGEEGGYYVISNFKTDPKEEKGIIINFRIPDGAQPGSYTLMAPDPLKIGQDFDVGVEMVEKGDLTFFHTNTEGTLHLDTFIPNRNNPSASTIKGTFQFVTENSGGNRISVEGAFDFPFEDKVMSSFGSEYSLANISMI